MGNSLDINTKKELIKVKGRLNMGVPFLGLTKRGNVYVPSFYFNDIEGIKSIDNNACEYFYSFRNGEKKYIKLNNNLDIKDKNSKFKRLSVATEENGKTLWLNIIAWGDIALDIHKNYSKGEYVFIEGYYDKKNRTIEIKTINKISN